MKASTLRRLEQLETKTTPAPVMPFRIVAYGFPDDGLYHGEEGETYTPDELEALKETHKVYLIEYVDWRLLRAAK